MLIKKFKSLILLTKSNSFSSKLNCSSLSVNRLETVLHLKLNRPDRRNCLTYELIRRLKEELIKFQNDSSLNSVFLTGSGGNFCAGLEREEIKNEETLVELSSLLQLFPLNKPSIVGLEGFVCCVGVQLALVFDYKVVEDDTVLRLNENHLPLHPYVKHLYREHSLIDLLDGKTSIKDLIAKQILTKNCTEGCCHGVCLEKGKCVEKFNIDSIIYDRNKLQNSSFETFETSELDNLIKILNHENLYTRSTRFLVDKIGRHANSQIDTLDEIYKKFEPKLVEEDELK